MIQKNIQDYYHYVKPRKRNNSSSSSADIFPMAIVLQIFSYLDINDIARSSMASKSWQNAVSQLKDACLPIDDDNIDGDPFDDLSKKLDFIRTRCKSLVDITFRGGTYPYYDAQFNSFFEMLRYRGGQNIQIFLKTYRSSLKHFSYIGPWDFNDRTEFYSISAMNLTRLRPLSNMLSLESLTFCRCFVYQKCEIDIKCILQNNMGMPSLKTLKLVDVIPCLFDVIPYCNYRPKKKGMQSLSTVIGKLASLSSLHITGSKWNFDCFDAEELLSGLNHRLQRLHIDGLTETSVTAITTYCTGLSDLTLSNFRLDGNADYALFQKVLSMLKRCPIRHLYFKSLSGCGDHIAEVRQLCTAGNTLLTMTIGHIYWPKPTNLSTEICQRRRLLKRAASESSKGRVKLVIESPYFHTM